METFIRHQDPKEALEIGLFTLENWRKVHRERISLVKQRQELEERDDISRKERNAIRSKLFILEKENREKQLKIYSKIKDKYPGDLLMSSSMTPDGESIF